MQGSSAKCLCQVPIRRANLRGYSNGSDGVRSVVWVIQNTGFKPVLPEETGTNLVFRELRMGRIRVAQGLVPASSGNRRAVFCPLYKPDCAT